jgi:hypothetical protein
MVEFQRPHQPLPNLEDGPKGYVGSGLRDGLQALVVPRVGECSIALRYPLMWGSVEANTSSTSAEPTW